MSTIIQTQDITGASRGTSSGIFIGVVKTFMVDYILSTKVGKWRLLFLDPSHSPVGTAIRAEGFLEQIRFFTRLIVNADQTDLLE